MRTITLIIIHCSATPEGKDYTVQDVDRWHRAKGWKMIGYHYLVLLDGTIQQGRPEDMIGSHCLNHNKYSIGVCYVGGLDANGHPKDTRTEAQKQSLRTLLQQLKSKYPNALIVSHHTFNPQKACPCFDAEHEYLQL